MMLWFVPQGPDLSQFVDSFCGALAHPSGPDPSRCPDSSCGALAHPSGPDPSRCPDSSCGALVGPAGFWLARVALIRSAGPWFALLGPGLSCGALICPEGPDPSREALQSDRESTSNWGPSGSMGPALTLEMRPKYMLVPVL